MAALTFDQKVTIGNNPTFQNRVGSILRAKALYWGDSTNTPNRGDVNIRMQKRKRLASSISDSSYVESYQTLIALYWLTTYNDSNPSLDGEGLPTAQVINDTFDPTYDHFAQVNSGDENELNIQW